MADRLREVAAEQGLPTKVAHVDGDNLIERAEELGLTDHGQPLTANAYLGAFGIVAGAVVAGHVIECGAQATGGNFSGFRALLDSGRADVPLGFPLAEISADGSCVITKHEGTGGLVSVDTVTAQLMYEIQSAQYLGPDVTAHLDTGTLPDDGPDRVCITGARGAPPPPTAKVCLNHLGGFRNHMELVLTGLDIDAKAAWVQRQVEAAWQSSGNPTAGSAGAVARPGRVAQRRLAATAHPVRPRCHRRGGPVARRPRGLRPGRPRRGGARGGLLPGRPAKGRRHHGVRRLRRWPAGGRRVAPRACQSDKEAAIRGSGRPGGSRLLVAPMPGTVVAVRAAVGDQVTAGGVLAVVDTGEKGDEPQGHSSTDESEAPA